MRQGVISPAVFVIIPLFRLSIMHQIVLKINIYKCRKSLDLSR
jgi:hypothetical protein